MFTAAAGCKRARGVHNMPGLQLWPAVKRNNPWNTPCLQPEPAVNGRRRNPQPLETCLVCSCSQLQTSSQRPEYAQLAASCKAHSPRNMPGLQLQPAVTEPTTPGLNEPTTTAPRNMSSLQVQAASKQAHNTWSMPPPQLQL